MIELKPSEQLWEFYDFVFPNGNDPIEDWYSGLDEDGQNRFDNLLKNDRKVEIPRHWLGFKRFLKGNEFQKYGLWELEFVAQGRQQRVLGVFGSKRKQAIFLVGCYHKQNVYTPPGALETAIRRAKLLKKGGARLHERKIKLHL